MDNLDLILAFIRSLSRNEKRFFKIHALRHVIGEQNNYVRLFDVLDKVKENYKRKDVLASLKSKGLARYFSSELNYISNLLIDSLCQYHSESKAEFRIKRLMQASQVLYEKNLYSHSLKLLKKAKAEAYEFDKFEELLRITSLEREIANQSLTTVEELTQVTNAIHQEEKEAIRKLNNKFDLRHLSDSIFLMAKKNGVARTEEQLNECRALFSNPLLKDDKAVLSYDAKRYFLNAHIFYYYMINDLKKNHQYRVKFIQLLDSNAQRRTEDIAVYLSGLNNVLFSCIQLLKKDDFFYYLDKLRQAPSGLKRGSNTAFVEKRVFESSYINETDYYIKTKEYEKGIKLVPAIEKGFKLFERSIEQSSAITLAFNVSCLYIGAGKFKNALPWNNRVLSHQKDVRQDLLCFAKILEIMIHYELGNKEQLHYYIKSAYRFFTKRKRIYQFEELFFKYLPKLIKLDDEKELKKIYSQLANELKVLKKKSNERIMFDDVDFLAWLESKN